MAEDHCIKHGLFHSANGSCPTCAESSPPNALEKHCVQWVKRSGLMEADSDYNGMVGRTLMDMVRALLKEGHSGGSMAITRQAFNAMLDEYEKGAG